MKVVQIKKFKLSLVGRGVLVPVGEGYRSLKSNRDKCSETKAPP
jgi:hypothetical protein